MVEKYTCKNPGCALYGKLIAFMRTSISKKDGDTRLCPSCEKKAFVAKTINVSSGPRHGSRRSSRR